MGRSFIRKRADKPDWLYSDSDLGKLINCVMKDGKKSVAAACVYLALELIKEKANTDDPISVFKDAIKNVSPEKEVKSKRVGGATYPVPRDISDSRSRQLAFRWIINAARSRGEHGFAKRLSSELMDASREQGSAYKKKVETHKVAASNKAFSSFQ
jgi:small subunit ribosomal protein S7